METINNNTEIKLLIVEDQKIIVDGLILILSNVEGFGNISYCLHYDNLIPSIRGNTPDVILLDFNIPHKDGIQCLKEIISIFPSQKVLMLTSYDDTELIREALKEGAKGYILKNIDKEELVVAIQKVYQGEKYLDSLVQKKVLEDFVTNSTNRHQSTKINDAGTKLSNREKEVLKLIAEGNSSGKIADSLFISVNTVDTHRKNIMAKCGVKKITELITFASKHNLI